jgi:hypothetical protein
VTQDELQKQFERSPEARALRMLYQHRLSVPTSCEDSEERQIALQAFKRNHSIQGHLRSRRGPFLGFLGGSLGLLYLFATGLVCFDPSHAKNHDDDKCPNPALLQGDSHPYRSSRGRS